MVKYCYTSSAWCRYRLPHCICAHDEDADWSCDFSQVLGTNIIYLDKFQTSPFKKQTCLSQNNCVHHFLPKPIELVPHTEIFFWDVHTLVRVKVRFVSDNKVRGAASCKREMFKLTRAHSGEISDCGCENAKTCLEHSWTVTQQKYIRAVSPKIVFYRCVVISVTLRRFVLQYKLQHFHLKSNIHSCSSWWLCFIIRYDPSDFILIFH